MIGWKRAAHIPTRRSWRKPVALHLEGLEDRLLLDAGFAGQAASALRGDLAHLRNDVATSTLTLINAIQSSPTNSPALASAANKAWSVLAADWQQTQQAWVQCEFAVLGAYQQAIITELADMGIRMPCQTPSPVPQPISGSGSGSGSNTGHSTPETSNLTTSTPLIRTKNVGSGSGFSRDGYGTFSGGGSSAVLVDDPTNLCNCGCTNEAGSLKQQSPLVRAPAPSLNTSAPVRYTDGIVTIAETDLHSHAFGFPWGQTRSWSNNPPSREGVLGAGSYGTLTGTNEPEYDQGSDNGYGWVDTYTPHLIEANNGSTNTLIYIANANTSYYYDLVNGAYQARINDGSLLTYNSGNDTYTLIDTEGNQIVLDGFGSSWKTAQQGQFTSFTSANGVTMAVTSYTSDGHIAEMRRSAIGNSNTIESWLYSYSSSNGQLSGVTLRTQVNGGAWNIVRQVLYTYYDGTQTYGGNAGDLMTATVEDGSGNVLSTSYYRYYTQTDLNNGQAGYLDGLKYVFNPDSYERLTAALGTNVANLTDAQVAPYADNYFQYQAYGTQEFVSSETVQGAGDSQSGGGQGTYTFIYTPSSNTPGHNSWAMKTLVTNPDGSTDKVYTDAYGEVMLDDHYDPSSGLHTDHFYVYNNNGQLTLAAEPTAVTGYNDAYADLLDNVNGSYQYLNNSSGLITRYDYYTTTTSTAVANYLEDEKIQQGQTGTLIPQETWQYTSLNYNGQTIGVISSDTVYRNSDGTGAETTSFTYTWYAGTAQIQSATETAPVISAAENGPGTADVTTIYYDQYGNAQWTKDPDGYIQYDAYDPLTGALLTQIVDVNTADSGEFTNLPSGWSTPSGGGLNLVTQYQVDALGRTTEETSPGGDITYYVYLDPQHEERIYRGWNSSTGTATLPTEVIREDSSGTYSEDLTMTATPHLTNGAPDGTEAIGNLVSLTRDYVNAAGQLTSEDAYNYLYGLTYSTSPMGTVNTNYYQTTYSYDNAGRLYQTTTANGTIYQATYNSLDETLSDWVGTSSSNLVQIASYLYDKDGNLTQETDYPGLNAANRVTQYWYDWRDLLVAEKDDVESSENDGVNRPIIVTTYDNLDEAIETQQYLGDNVTPTIANGVLQPLPAANLRADETDSYDEQGRVYRTQIFDVNPINGTESGALTASYYYDHRGNLIAESDPGGLWSKSQYDGAGRDVMDYSTDGAGGTSWTGAASVASDTVLEQVQTVYDADSNPIETIDRQRFHNATGSGALGSPTSGIGARVYYAAEYYDNVDRVIADVDAGTNGGAAWTRPGTVPSSSATLLVTTYAYTYYAAGLYIETHDPLGIDTHTNYDNLGRLTRIIQNYTGQAETTESDVSTNYYYDGNNNVTYVQANEPGGAYQETRYLYGVTTAGGSGVNSNDILSAIQHPDPSTGHPSSSQQDKYLTDALGDVVQSTDRNGTVHQYSYDVLGRLTSDKVTTLASGVDGTVRQITYGYDSQGNLSLITSLDANSNILNQVERAYNGLGQMTREYQNVVGAVNINTTPQVQYWYNEMANGENNSRLTQIQYPSGYQVYYNYNSGLDDTISRLSSIADSTSVLESYKYLGLSTIVEMDHPQTGINLTYISQTGQNGSAGDQYSCLDQFGRVAEQNWYNPSSHSSADDYQYQYNQDGEVIARTNVLDASMNESYGYDKLGRLTSFQRGNGHNQSWTLDALGNVSSVTTDGGTQNRTSNQQNEYTSASGSATVSYDADGNFSSGNLTGNGATLTYVYDAWN